MRDPDGNLIAIRVGPTSTPTSATEYYPFTDNLGNVRAMVTATGVTPNVAYTYSAYGTTTSTTASLVQPYRYGSGYTDTSTGLIKLGARYYDPINARFAQHDPTGKEQNPYTYTRNCPATNDDPSGGETLSNCVKTIDGATIGGAITGAFVGALFDGAPAIPGAIIGGSGAAVGAGATCLYNFGFDALN